MKLSVGKVGEAGSIHYGDLEVDISTYYGLHNYSIHYIRCACPPVN
jgi:hypothetical protein